MATGERPLAIDCWLNPTWRATDHRPEFLVRVARDYFIQFMNTRGGHKVLFASDHPVLSFERCVTEAAALPLREGILAKYLRENALGLFRWDIL